jgi:hypothetical protein
LTFPSDNLNNPQFFNSSESSESSESPDYLSENWCGLKWSPWVKHKNFREESVRLPKLPGLYRVRVIDGGSLVYIGQTGRSVRKRQSELIVYLKDPGKMSFNDPHTAAPNLWAWADAEGFEFESSGAFFEGTKQDREGMEAYLLWQYRLVYITPELDTCSVQH